MNSCAHCCTKIEGLTVEFNRETVLDDVNLHLDCGEVVGLVGPNGAGKTTLLRAILKEVAYRGRITFRVSGRDSGRPQLGYVPQKLNFDPGSPVSVADFTAAALSSRPVWLGINRKLREKVKSVLSVFSAGHLLDRKIGELSGGELQRVLLAVAMTPEPSLLLLDEPGSGVDVNGLALFYGIVRRLREEHDIAVILVTHDLAGISAYVDRIVLLNNRVIAEGKPGEVLSNEQLVKTFGPGLWNISRLPEVRTDKTEDNGGHGSLV